MDQSEEELYELAKEEGSVTFYSISSRCTKIAEAFMEKYPGIECEPFDISTNELLEKVTREHEAGQNVADVVHIKDQDGSLWNEYVQNKIFYNYLPSDIAEHIDPKYTETQVPLYIELTRALLQFGSLSGRRAGQQHLGDHPAGVEGPHHDAEPAG